LTSSPFCPLPCIALAPLSHSDLLVLLAVDQGARYRGYHLDMERQLPGGAVVMPRAHTTRGQRRTGKRHNQKIQQPRQPSRPRKVFFKLQGKKCCSSFNFSFLDSSPDLLFLPMFIPHQPSLPPSPQPNPQPVLT